MCLGSRKTSETKQELFIFHLLQFLLSTWSPQESCFSRPHDCNSSKLVEYAQGCWNLHLRRQKSDRHLFSTHHWPFFESNCFATYTHMDVIFLMLFVPASLTFITSHVYYLVLHQIILLMGHPVIILGLRFCPLNNLKLIPQRKLSNTFVHSLTRWLTPSEMN